MVCLFLSLSKWFSAFKLALRLDAKAGRSYISPAANSSRTLIMYDTAKWSDLLVVMGSQMVHVSTDQTEGGTGPF